MILSCVKSQGNFCFVVDEMGVNEIREEKKINIIYVFWKKVSVLSIIVF